MRVNAPMKVGMGRPSSPKRRTRTRKGRYRMREFVAFYLAAPPALDKSFVGHGVTTTSTACVVAEVSHVPSFTAQYFILTELPFVA